MCIRDRDAIFPKDANGKRTNPDPGKILLEGLQRGTTKKEKVGLPVILPIPEGISDTNSASWGPDQMNNMSAAVLATMMKNIGFTGGALAASAITKMFTGANAMPLATMISILSNIPGGAGANEAVQAQITCLLYTSPSPRDATLSRMPSSA